METNAEGTGSPVQFDVGNLEVAEDATTEIEIFDPNSKRGIGVFITLYSKDSGVARKIARKQQDRRLTQMKRGRGGISLTAEEIESEALDMLVGCTKTWRPMVRRGKPFDFSPENARDLYESSAVIREQVDDAINDRALFLKR